MSLQENDNPPDPKTYADALRELEQIVVQIESGQLQLEELAKKYERGNRLLAYCKKKLERVNAQIKKIDSSN